MHKIWRVDLWLLLSSSLVAVLPTWGAAAVERSVRRDCCGCLRRCSAHSAIKRPMPAPTPRSPVSRSRLQARPGFADPMPAPLVGSPKDLVTPVVGSLSSSKLVDSPAILRSPTQKAEAAWRVMAQLSDPAYKSQRQQKLATYLATRHLRLTEISKLPPRSVAFYLQEVCRETWLLLTDDHYKDLGSAQKLVENQQLVGAYFWQKEGVARSEALRRQVLGNNFFLAGVTELSPAQVEAVIQECKILYAQELTTAGGNTGSAVAAAVARKSSLKSAVTPTVGAITPGLAVSVAPASSAPAPAPAVSLPLLSGMVSAVALEALPERTDLLDCLPASATTVTTSDHLSAVVSRPRVSFRAAPRSHRLRTASEVKLCVQAQLFNATDPVICSRYVPAGEPKSSSVVARAEAEQL